MIKNEDGFTLIEILVSMNLSFILITVIMTWYLFTYKFTSGTIKKNDKKYEVTTFLYRTYDLLERSDDFCLIQKKDFAALVVGTKDTIKFGQQSISDNYFKMNLEIDDYTVNIEKLNGTQFTVKGGSFFSGNFDWHDSYLIQSTEVKKINIIITKFGKDYKLDFFNPATGIKAFTNIEKLK